ncbi:Gfo/Idh/MocA family protein [Paenibacillus sp. GCM10023252]|uniref:Gfo/Idh/MocA family protein n=1 Tax=Paenibacillus sp. GCM10023252 TaxID=3252649 RepID=UPI00361DA34B
MSTRLKVGLIGLGAIGAGMHVKYLDDLPSVELTGVCDQVKEKADQIAEQYRTTAFYDYKELYEKADLDVVILAVPHYDHPKLAVEAFKRGIHVLCEKPIAVHLNDARMMTEAYEEARKQYPKLQFGLMFQERTLPFYRKVKEIVASGQLGRLTRATWIHTAWFRSQIYYDSGDWRATWAGEGGGILTNQCPHTLDMYQWLFGLPARIAGHAHIGKYHNIEVEDEVTAYFEHENGMIGHLVATTAEIPGTNRLEIIGEYGKLVLEEGEITLHKNPESMLKYSQETTHRFSQMTAEKSIVPYDKDAPAGHQVVAEAFFHRIQNGDSHELIAEGWEGERSLVLANGIMLSSFQDRTIQVPIDADAYEAKLKELASQSTYVKDVSAAAAANEDLSKSFGSL